MRGMLVVLYFAALALALLRLTRRLDTFLDQNARLSDEPADSSSDGSLRGENPLEGHGRP